MKQQFSCLKITASYGYFYITSKNRALKTKHTQHQSLFVQPLTFILITGLVVGVSVVFRGCRQHEDKPHKERGVFRQGSMCCHQVIRVRGQVCATPRCVTSSDTLSCSNETKEK